MSSKIGQGITHFNGAQYVAPFVHNNVEQSAKEAMGAFFGGNDPRMQFEPQTFNTQTGPTTAFSTTVEARRWDHVVNSFLLMEKMHKHQEFPLLLAPLELAKGMKFTTRIFTSNLEPPEEAPEHVPAPFSTTQWSETTTALRMVHRSVKFSLHELKTEKGQQDYKVHLHNLSLMFLRDTHNVIVRKFARQQTVLAALASFYPPTETINMELTKNTIRNFGSLNSSKKGLDVLVSNVKQVGTVQNVNFDTVVVPYGSMANLALDDNHFQPDTLAITMARDLAKMADINEPANIPTYVFDNKFNVFQYQRTADQMQNPDADPMTNRAVVSTYHPFGSDRFTLQNSRDIRVVDATTNSFSTLKLEDAIEKLPTVFWKPKGNDVSFAQKLKGKGMSVATARYIATNFKKDMLILDTNLVAPLVVDDEPGDNKFSFPADAANTAAWKALGQQEDTWADALQFLKADFTKKNALALVQAGYAFPFDIIAVRPFIELETGNAIFCKRGRETAVTYCLPPWSMVGRDNRIEMVDMKFGFWRECHIERPSNILVAEHAFVNRVHKGMGTRAGTQETYYENPLEFGSTADWYPFVVGPIDTEREWQPMYNTVKEKSTFFEDREMEFTDSEKRFEQIYGNKMSPSVTLWDGDVLNEKNFPRVSCLGTTQRCKVEVVHDKDGFKAVRNVNTDTLKNVGHMKDLDSVEGVSTLTGFAMNGI